MGHELTCSSVATDISDMGPCDCGAEEITQCGQPECDCCKVADKLHERIAELEAALKPFANAVYSDNHDVTVTMPEIGDYMRAKRVLSGER